MKNEGYIKLNRGAHIEKLLLEFYNKRPTALVLLFLIAHRARRSEDKTLIPLFLGEALIGDWRKACITEQIYRTDKKFLEKHGFITCRSTSKGTIAKLVDSTVFDINPTSSNVKSNGELTSSQRAANVDLTTNKNVKNVKNEKNIYITPQSITEEDMQEIAGSLSVNIRDVKRKYNELADAVEASPRKYNYSNYKAALRNWVRRAIADGKIQQRVQVTDNDPLLQAALRRAEK